LLVFSCPNLWLVAGKLEDCKIKCHDSQNQTNSIQSGQFHA
jgi:hypothetical protein